ncbi:MAG: hypothetical protein EOP11_17095 [Proteobacteria bacterium]|nr:MAG: hypothetical protein EOP11_17095 [Pseudomonadota bacterium]
MKFSVIALSSLLSPLALASGFSANSPVPAQLQGTILEAVTENCGKSARHEISSVQYDTAGETYFETKLGAESRPSFDLVISGIGRMGGMGVIKVDCAE